jgi:hypothetical protein
MALFRDKLKKRYKNRFASSPVLSGCVTPEEFIMNGAILYCKYLQLQIKVLIFVLN